MKHLILLVVMLIHISFVTTAQLAGEWVGQAVSVAQLRGQAKTSVKVTGNKVSGTFQTQMDGMIQINFEGQLTDINNATCIGYIDGSPELYVILSKQGQTLNVNLRNQTTNYLNATLSRKVAKTNGIVNENIVGTWKIIDYTSSTKTTMFLQITEDGRLGGSQNSFFSTGYGRDNNNISGESNNEPIPFIQELNRQSARVYSKGPNQLWIKTNGQADRIFFDYQIVNGKLILPVNGRRREGERVGF